MTTSPRATRPPATSIALMVTRRCNMACGHCSVESGPQVRGEPTEEELREQVRQAAVAGVLAINLTGGEPMLRPRTVLRLVRLARRLGVATSLTTNGSWGRTAERARRGVRRLKRAGLATLAVSVDRYHDEFQGPAAAAHVARAAEEAGLPARISLVTPAGGDDRIADLVAPFEGLRQTRLRFYALQAVGRARDLPGGALGGAVDGFCAACAVPAVTDDGRVTACNGPAYFAPASSPLIVGSLATESLPALLARHRTDPVLDTIRTFGPARLREELRALPGFEDFPFRPRYRGICDLCLHVTSDARAVAALRTRLDDPRLAAERRAVWLVAEDSRRRGALNPGHINGPGVGAVFLRAATEPPEARWGPDADRILARADIDWRHWAGYLAACGLARPLLSTLADPRLAGAAPAFFAEALRAAALREGMLELVQQEALRQVDAALRAIGARGVLLKGMALHALVRQRAAGLTPRATGDVDVYVPSGDADRLRARLLDAGFRGEPRARPTSTHHLAPVAIQGVAVEIHTRIAAPFWGLPEREMLARARPLLGTGALDALDGAGLVLHAMVHCTQGCFSHGLRAAWDVLAIHRVDPAIEWDQLARWVAGMRVPRAFWVPLAVLVRELALPVPPPVLAGAPRDALARRLEAVARRRLFRAAEQAGELDPVSRHGLILLLHGSTGARLRYIGALARWATTRPRRREGRAGTAPSPRAWLRGAWRRLGQYRRATAVALADED